MRKQHGISLLEMLLVLVVASSIILMSVQFFAVTNRNSESMQAITQIQMLTQASYTWLQSQRQANFSDSANGKAISLQTLFDAGLIEPNTKNRNPNTLLNPWGGAISVSPATNPNYVQISMENIPLKDCQNLVRRLKSVNLSFFMTLCNAKPNTFYGAF